MSAPRRDYLGSYIALGERTRVFRAAEALEVDSSDYYEIRRRRVFFDEILLVTLHRERAGGVLAWLLAVLAAFSVLFAAILSSEPEARSFFAISAAILGGLCLFLFLLPAWVVTVFGQRTRARMRYRLRPKKARETWDEICRLAEEAQRRPAPAAGPLSEVPLPGPPPPPPLPPPAEG